MLDELDDHRSAMGYLAERAVASGGVVTGSELEAFTYLGEQIKLTDQSRGIRTLASAPSSTQDVREPRQQWLIIGGRMRRAVRPASG